MRLGKSPSLIGLVPDPSQNDRMIDQPWFRSFCSVIELVRWAAYICLAT